jgi:hypothetical protein
MVQRRTTAIVLASVLLLVTSGVVVAQTGSVIDGFEDNDLSEYTGSTDKANIVTSPVKDGQYALEMIDNGTTSYEIQSFNGLNEYPDTGDTFEVWLRGDQSNPGIKYGVQDDGSVRSKGYGVQIYPVEDEISLFKRSTSGNFVELSNSTANIANNEWYRVSVDWSANGTMSASVYNETGQKIGQTNGKDDSYNDGGIAFVLGQNIDGDTPSYFDSATITSEESEYDVSGRVKDENTNEYIQSVTIEAYDDGTLIDSYSTNSIGQYNLSLPNGTYTVWANATDYQNENRTITVDGEDQIQNFALASFNASINLRARNFMDHGESTPYSVIVTIDGDRKDVTDTATVTSSNTSVVTVDSQAAELVATSNLQVNDRVTITAEYTDQNGNVYVTQQNVTVANETVENIGILPTASRFTASIDDQTIQAILVAIGFGAAASIIASSFAGLGATTLIMTIAWLADYVGDGMIIVTVLVALFIGLNMALNIDYTVTKGG